MLCPCTYVTTESSKSADFYHLKNHHKNPIATKDDQCIARSAIMIGKNNGNRDFEIGDRDRDCFFSWRSGLHLAKSHIFEVPQDAGLFCLSPTVAIFGISPVLCHKISTEKGGGGYFSKNRFLLHFDIEIFRKFPFLANFFYKFTT